MTERKVGKEQEVLEERKKERREERKTEKMMCGREEGCEVI